MDPKALARARAEGDYRVAPVCEGRVFLRWTGGVPQAFLPAAGEAREMLEHAHSPVWLGEREGRPVFAVALRRFRPARRIPDGDFGELRQVAGLIPDPDWALLARARALVTWHETHGYCSRCGHPAPTADDGLSRQCANPACGALSFPRVDPAVIMRVTDGDRILLGRQAEWPPKRWSVIAGFVSPGESAEEAVAREVAEETGIRLRPDRIRYVESQPWPFPGTLMLAFTAEAETSGIVRRDAELEAAAWFTRDELDAGIRSGDMDLPTPRSVARTLIEDWRRR